jgi:hypothetical protein
MDKIITRLRKQSQGISMVIKNKLQERIVHKGKLMLWALVKN